MAPQAHKTISAYHSRARVVGLTKALAVELGQQGICCNGIVPGFFATELASGPVKDPEFTSFIYGWTLMQRWVDPNELSGVSVFLLSNATYYTDFLLICYAYL